MLLDLKPHPDTPSDAVTKLEVSVHRVGPRGLALGYIVEGDPDRILLPHAASSVRADDLWRHTCFEAFVRAESGSAYFEFNLSPSTEWAAYRFDDYRAGMAAAFDAEIGPLDSRTEAGAYLLTAHLDLEQLSSLSPNAPWRLGLSAVIEETNGRKSYWALAHPPGKPDFHHRDSFAATLPPVEQP